MSNLDEGLKEREEQAKKIIQWRDCLTRLPDNLFFQLVRMYLGEIKTPYNKQNLLEKLGSFLHKEQVQKNILLLLSHRDCQILTAISLLDYPSQDKLQALLEGNFTSTQLHENLMNLEERLIIFCNTCNPLPKQQPAYFFNPILEPILRTRIHPAYLFPLPHEFQNLEEQDSIPHLTPALLAALFSFVREFPDLSRQDGTIKKRVFQRLSQVFPMKFTEKEQVFFQTLVVALQNLSLLKEAAKGFVPDYQLWLKFAELPFQLQTMYLVAAACGRDTRSNLQKKVSILLSMTKFCPPEGFTKDGYLRLEYLLEHLNVQEWSKNQVATESALGGRDRRGVSGSAGGSRFAKMMAAAEQQRFAKEASQEALSQDSVQTQGDQDDCPHWCKNLFEAGTRLGVFRQTGTGYGVKNTMQPVFHPHLPQPLPPVPERGHLTLDSALTATMLPGLSLGQMLPLMHFMRLRRYDTAMTLEITKNSCLQHFDEGSSPKDIQQTLSLYMIHKVPQSLSVSLEDWHHSYSLATLYKGYVLHLKNKKDISNHPILAEHIALELEPGIYLMNFTSDQEAQEILAKGGFENSGTVKKAPQATSLPSFPQNIQELPLEHFFKEPPGEKINWESQELLQKEYLAEMEDKLNQMDLPSHQQEGLHFRLSRRILLLPDQLQGSSVKVEQFEASGMDFVGKIHVAEQAISHGSVLKLTYIQQGQEPKIVVGIPVAIKKDQGDSLVVLQDKIKKEVTSHSLGQAHIVRRIQGSIFAVRG